MVRRTHTTPCFPTDRTAAAASVDEVVLFSGPDSQTPTRIRLRVFEFPGGGGGPGVAILSEAEHNRGLSLTEIEAGIPHYDRHAVPSDLTGLAAVAARYCRSFWDGIIVLLELPLLSPAGQPRFVVRYQVTSGGDADGAAIALPDTLGLADVRELLAALRPPSQEPGKRQKGAAV